MANKISIVIGVQNRASAPIRRVRRDVGKLQRGLRTFNRDLFATTALIGTFTMAFRKAIQVGKIGAQFEYISNQFTKTFGIDYLQTLKIASRHTVDSLVSMQQAMQAYAAGMDKTEIKQAFGISVAAAKVLGISTEQAIKKIINNLKIGRYNFLATFAETLKYNNAFQNLNKMIMETTKGWGAAGLKGKAYRKAVLHAGWVATQKLLDVQEDSLEILMRTGASFRDLRNVVGEFIARAMAPLAKSISVVNEKGFLKLFSLLKSTDPATQNVRDGIVDLIKTLGASIGTLTAFWGSFKILSLFLSTAGISMSGFAGAMTLFALAMAGAKGQNESWLQLLSRIGTEFKVYFEAFSSYKDGFITLTGETAKRFGLMDEDVRNRIWFMIKVLAVVREGLTGFGEGFKFVFETIRKGLTWFGIWDEKTKKLSQTWATLAKWTGRVVGFLMAFRLLKMAGGAFLGGIGGIGRMAGLGRGSSALNPVFTQDVGTLLGRGARAIPAAGAGLLGYGKSVIRANIGWILSAVIGYSGWSIYKSITGKAQETAFGRWGEWLGEKAYDVFSNPDAPSVLGVTRGKGSISKERIAEFKNSIGEVNKDKKEIDITLLKQAIDNHHATSAEILDVSRSVRDKKEIISPKGAAPWLIPSP